MRSRVLPIPFLLAASATARAEPEPALDAVSSVAFGDTLLEAQDPFNALTYYRLGLFLAPERQDASRVWFRIALCYERGDRWAAATQAWLDLAGRDPEWSPHATYRAAMSALDRDQFGEARIYFDEVRLEASDSPWAERASFMIPVVDLEAGNLPTALQELETFEATFPASPLVPRSAAARGVLQGKAWRRSPLLAAGMSTLLPGSGQLYAGHVGDGIMAFLADGTLAFFSYALLRQGIEDDRGWEVGAGATVGTIALFAWSSNVLGAYQGAHRANRHHERRRIEAALQEIDHPDLERRPEDVPLP